MQIPKGQKKTESFAAFFALLGSAGIKAVHKTMVGLTPMVNFIKYLCARFSYKSAFVLLPKPKHN